MKPSFETIWAAFVAICVLWGIIRHIVTKIRERSQREPSNQTAFSISELRPRFSSWIHWQRREEEFFNRFCKYSIERIESEDQRRQFEVECTIESSRLKSGNRRFNKATAFSGVATLLMLLNDVPEGIACAIMLFGAPYLLAKVYEDDKSIGRCRHIPLDLIERKATARDIFANAVWVIAISIFIAYVCIRWGTFERG
jgi:hypothetical protein